MLDLSLRLAVRASFAAFAFRSKDGHRRKSRGKAKHPVLGCPHHGVHANEQKRKTSTDSMAVRHEDLLTRHQFGT